MRLLPGRGAGAPPKKSRRVAEAVRAEGANQHGARPVSAPWQSTIGDFRGYSQTAGLYGRRLIPVSMQVQPEMTKSLQGLASRDDKSQFVIALRECLRTGILCESSCPASSKKLAAGGFRRSSRSIRRLLRAHCMLCKNVLHAADAYLHAQMLVKLPGVFVKAPHR